MIGYVNALKETCYRFADEAQKKSIPIPEDLKGTLAEMQASLTETAAENDEALLDKYFEDGALSKDEIIHGIRKGIYNVTTIPVMAGSALQNRGIINLMDEIVKYMPSAEERQRNARDRARYRRTDRHYLRIGTRRSPHRSSRRSSTPLWER